MSIVDPPRFWLNDTIEDPRGIGIVDEEAGGVIAYATSPEHGAAIVDRLNAPTTSSETTSKAADQ